MEKLNINLQFDDDKELRAQMREAYEKCAPAKKYVQELGIPEEAINKSLSAVYDFVSDLNYCKKCPGINNCNKNNGTLCVKIDYVDGIVERRMVPCKEILRRMTLDKQFYIADFDKSLLDLSLKDVDQNKGRKEALAKYISYIKDGRSNWLYLCGGPGSGKSYFAGMLACDAAKNNRSPIIFANATRRIKELSDLQYSDKEEFQKMLNRYCTCELLVLDDFANEFKSEFVRDAIVFPILSMRASKKLMTIITSDFTIEDVETLYACNSKAGGIRARQISQLLRALCDKEIIVGDLPIYK